MLMLSVILALLLGWCTGGRLSRFEEADLRLPAGHERSGGPYLPAL